MARRTFDVLDVTEVLVHWYAGRSKLELSASLGMDRKTVRKYIAPAQAEGLIPGGPPIGREAWAARVRAWFPELADSRLRQPTWSDLARHHDYIASMLGILPMNAIHQVLRDKHGVTASPASLRRYVRANLPEQVRRVPLEPGAQAHVDHGYLGTWHNPGTGQRQKVWAFVMSLPASRHMFVYPVLAMDQRAWAAGHVAAFEFFGGVPARLVPADPRTCKPTLCDPKLNRLYVELAAHFGTLVDPARSARPSRGSHADRQLPYVRDSFWRAADFRSLDEMRAAAVEWCREVAGRRPHRQFGGATPIGVYTSVEADALGALPTEPFTMSTWTTVTVGADGFAKVGRTLYSLPWRHAGASLDVRQTDTEVQFFQQDQLVKTHARRPRGRQADPADHPLCVPLHARSSEPKSRTSDNPLWAVAGGCARSGVRHWLRSRYVIRPALRWRPCRSRGAMGAGRFREGI